MDVFCAVRDDEMTPTHILLLNPSGRLSPRVQNEVISLARAGYQIHVVHFQRDEAREDTEFPAEVRVSRVKLNAPIGSWFLIFYLPIFYLMMFWRLRKEQPHVVHCTNLFLLPFSLLFAKWKRAKVVYDVYELHSLDFSQYVPRLSRPMQNVIEFFENIMVRQVSLVLTIDSIKGFLIRRYGQFNSNVYVLYNVVPRGDLNSHPEWVQELGERYTDFRLITYVGGMYEQKGLLKMLQALSLVKERVPNVKLLLIGTLVDPSGTAMSDLRSNDLLDNFEFIPWVPYDEMCRYLQICEVGLAPHQPEGRNLFVSRGNGVKFFSYMQAGLPIVAPNFGEIGRLVLEEQCGILVDTTDSQQIGDAIIYLLERPDEAKEMGKRARLAIEQKYNWETEQEKLLNAYRGLTAQEVA